MKFSLLIIASFLTLNFARADETLKGGVFPLPGGLIESADKGLFIDVLRDIEACLPKGVSASRVMYPAARVMGMVTREKPELDFAFPGIANPLKDVKSPYIYTAPYGKVSFVIYSNVKKPISREDLLKHKGDAKFPYEIEGFPSVMTYFPFPMKPFTCVECALKKVELGRLDAFIMAMDEVDDEIRKAGMTDIHRSLYENFDAVVVVPDTAHGKAVKAILDQATECALKKGSIKSDYAKVHKSYDDWQPSALKRK